MTIFNLWISSILLILMAPSDLSELPGPREIEFLNGSTARGEILSVEGDKFKFEPYDGAAFMIPLDRIESARELLPSEIIGEKVKALVLKGKIEESARFLSETLSDDSSDLSGDLEPLRDLLRDIELKIKQRNSKAKDGRRAKFRERYDQMLDRRQWQEALALTKDELLLDPDDVELLEAAVMMEYRLHRGRSGEADAFRSFTMDRLRKADPKSAVLKGLDSEMRVATRLKEDWEKERNEILDSAYEIASEQYENFLLEAAKETLDRALALNPDPAPAAEMRKLLAKIEGELATQTADDRARERKKLEELRAKAKEDLNAGRFVTSSQSANAQRQLQKRGGGVPKKVYQRAGKK